MTPNTERIPRRPTLPFTPAPVMFLFLWLNKEQTDCDFKNHSETEVKLHTVWAQGRDRNPCPHSLCCGKPMENINSYRYNGNGGLFVPWKDTWPQHLSSMNTYPQWDKYKLDRLHVVIQSVILSPCNRKVLLFLLWNHHHRGCTQSPSHSFEVMLSPHPSSRRWQQLGMQRFTKDPWCYLSKTFTASKRGRSRLRNILWLSGKSRNRGHWGSLVV